MDQKELKLNIPVTFNPSILIHFGSTQKIIQQIVIKSLKIALLSPVYSR